ncbi:MAG: hypothetical protein V4721_06945 [Bacteroidota bacterium]
MSTQIRNIFQTIDSVVEILLPRNRFPRLITLLLITVFLCLGAIGIALSEFKKKDILNSQLEIEKNRVSMIDKGLQTLYSKTYISNDSIQKNLLSQIEFLKKQRIDAVSSIDKINDSPDSQMFLFSMVLAILTMVIVSFFSTSFRYNSKSYTHDEFELERYSKKQTRSRVDTEFLGWMFENEIANQSLSRTALHKTQMLKKLYDQTESLGEKRSDVLLSMLEYAKIERSQEDIAKSGNNQILRFFSDTQDRIKDECNRLNKQALINLFLCFFIAFVLITVVTYTSFFSSDLTNSSSLEMILIRLAPRILTVAGLLTMFLYFVKMYKANIADVKYYQNELTNVEMYQVAWQTSVLAGDSKASIDIISKFTDIDRNRIIATGQTTIELERLRLENEFSKSQLAKSYELITKTVGLGKKPRSSKATT